MGEEDEVSRRGGWIPPDPFRVAQALIVLVVVVITVIIIVQEQRGQ